MPVESQVVYIRIEKMRTKFICAHSKWVAVLRSPEEKKEATVLTCPNETRQYRPYVVHTLDAVALSGLWMAKCFGTEIERQRKIINISMRAQSFKIRMNNWFELKWTDLIGLDTANIPLSKCISIVIWVSFFSPTVHSPNEPSTCI